MVLFAQIRFFLIRQYLRVLSTYLHDRRARIHLFREFRWHLDLGRVMGREQYIVDRYNKLLIERRGGKGFKPFVFERCCRRNIRFSKYFQ